MKFWENYKKISKNLRKIETRLLNDTKKIIEILLRKIEVIRNWCCWYYEEILENLSEIISVKLGKNYEEIFKKHWKNMGNTSHKL